LLTKALHNINHRVKKRAKAQMKNNPDPLQPSSPIKKRAERALFADYFYLKITQLFGG